MVHKCDPCHMIPLSIFGVFKKMPKTRQQWWHTERIICGKTYLKAEQSRTPDWAGHAGGGDRHKVAPGVGHALMWVEGPRVPEPSPVDDLVVGAVPGTQLHVRLVGVHIQAVHRLLCDHVCARSGSSHTAGDFAAAGVRRQLDLSSKGSAPCC